MLCLTSLGPRSSGIEINAVVDWLPLLDWQLSAHGRTSKVSMFVLKRTKAVIAAALGLDIALVVLLGLSIQRSES